MEYIIAFLFISFLFFFIVRRNEERINVYIISGAIVTKIIAGLIVGVIYKWYYTGGDTYRMFEQLAVFNHDYLHYFISYLTDSTLKEPRVKVFLALISPFYILSKGNYWVMSIYLSCLVSLPWIFLFKIIFTHYKKYSFIVLIMFFYPTIMLWGSGLLKETLLLASMYFGAYVIVYTKRYQAIRLIHMLVLLFSFYFLWQVKYYYFLPLMMLGLAFICLVNIRIHTFLKQHIRLVISISIGFSLVVLFLILPLIHENLHLSHIIQAIIRNNEIMKMNSPSHSFVDYKLEEGFLSLLLNFPKAIFSAYFFPLFRYDSLLVSLASIENCFLLIATLYVLYSAVRQGIRLRIYHYLLLCYLLIVPGLIALATPNLGTLNRYAIGYLPIYLFFIGSLMLEVREKIRIDKKDIGNDPRV